jgi:hypothetical protein
MKVFLQVWDVRLDAKLNRFKRPHPLFKLLSLCHSLIEQEIDSPPTPQCGVSQKGRI